jgi:hypothetical protein
MKKKIITETEIRNTKVSDEYKAAILNAYKYAKEDEDGGFFEKACAVFSYITELTDVVPTGVNGIEYDKLVDNRAPWTEIDKRIVKVILNAYDKTKFYSLSSWLYNRLEEVENDNFFPEVYQILLELAIVTSEKDAIEKLILGYSDILIMNDMSTSFGKIALTHFNEIWKSVKNNTARRVKKAMTLYSLYELLKIENEPVFNEHSKMMLEDIINSGKNGRYYAILATEQNEPETALLIAKEESTVKYKRTAYRVYFFAKKTNNNEAYYRDLLWNIYKEHAETSEDRKRIIEIWGEEDGAPLLKLFKT